MSDPRTLEWIGEELAGCAPGLTVTRSDTQDGVRLTAAGEIDLVSAPILTAQLHRAIGDGDGLIVVDLGDVTFMNSAGVHALADAHHSTPHRLRLGRLHPAARRVLEIAALLDVFALADDPSPSPHP